jgi:hypothetical protein
MRIWYLFILLFLHAFLSGCAVHQVSSFVENDDLKGAETYLSKGGTQRLIPFTTGHPFPHACSIGDLQMVKLIYEYRNQLLTVMNSQQVMENNKTLCLINAATSGHIEVIKWAHEVEGFSLNTFTTDHTGFGSSIPLKAAIDKSQYETVDYLLEKGAFPYAVVPDFNFLALNQAVELNDIKMVELLVKNHINLNYHLNGKTGLIVAIEKDNIDIVKFLLNNGGIISYNETSIIDPLTVARKHNRKVIEALLLEGGAIDRQKIIRREKELAVVKRNESFKNTIGEVADVAVAIIGVALGVAAIYYVSKDSASQPTIYNIDQKNKVENTNYSESININESCTSDYSCGAGYGCIKKPFSISGVCLKLVDSFGIPTNSLPNPNSLGVKDEGSCQYNIDCAIGFKCDTKLKACVK